MKKLALAAIVFIFIIGCSSSPESKTYGPYNVTGNGNTCDQARDNAFRIAVEQSFGTAVMAERQMKKDVLTRDDVLSHSSGFVENYNILSTENTSSGCTIKMTATVKPSMVNKYIFNEPNFSNISDGDKINTKVNTYLDSKNRSDSILDGLFTDYVNRAYKVQEVSMSYEIDDYRQTIMVVHYNVIYNDEFMKALNYTLSKIEDKCEATLSNQLVGGCSRVPKFIVKYIPDGSIFPSSHHYFFNDMQTPTKINDLLLGQCEFPWNTAINIYGNNDNLLYSKVTIPYKQVPNVYTERNGWGKELNMIFWQHPAMVKIPLKNFSAGEMKRVDVKLIDTSKKINGKCL